MPRTQHIVRLSREDRTKLQAMVRHGHQSAWTLQRARILLKTDTSQPGPRLTDAQVATAVDAAAPGASRDPAQTGCGPGNPPGRGRLQPAAGGSCPLVVAAAGETRRRTGDHRGDLP